MEEGERQFPQSRMSFNRSPSIWVEKWHFEARWFGICGRDGDEEQLDVLNNVIIDAPVRAANN